MTLIRAEGLTVSRGGQVVLAGVSVAIEPGEILTVVGPNGSGKTTLLRAMVGALPPSAGKVWRKPGLRLGYVPQGLNIDATLPVSVGRFLALPKRVPGAAEALDRVGLSGMEGRAMSELSGGQFQRAMLARALLGTPEVLMLDEPTTGLDQPGSAEFYGLIAEVRRELGCAVVMVSHELHVVMAASDRVICLNGHVCCEGTPEHVASAPEYRALFGSGTEGMLALYRHEHDHSHSHGDGHVHGPGCDHDHGGH